MHDLIGASSNAAAGPNTVDPGQPYHRLNPDNFRDGYIVIMRPLRTRPGHDDGHYWNGPLAPDCSVRWLRYVLPTNGAVTVPEDMSVFTTHLDATVAWAAYLSVRRRRRTPVLDTVIEVVALQNIPDLGTVPAFGASRSRGTAS